MTASLAVDRVPAATLWRLIVRGSVRQSALAENELERRMRAGDQAAIALGARLAAERMGAA